MTFNEILIFNIAFEMTYWFWWRFFPKPWSQCIFFQVSDISLGLTKLLGPGPCVCHPQWTRRPSDLFSEGGGGPADCLEQSWALKIKTRGCAMPISPALDEDHLEGDGICLHIVLLQMSWPWPCTLPAKDSSEGDIGASRERMQPLPSSSHLPPVIKVGLVGPPRDQIQSNCCFALLSAYVLSPIASQWPEEAGDFLRQGNWGTE